MSVKMRKCIGPCGRELEENLENFSFRNDTKKFKGMCRPCRNAEAKIYRGENKEIISINAKIYYENNKEYFSEYKKQHRLENLDELRNYDKIRNATPERKQYRKDYGKKYNKNRIKEDVEFRFRKNISSSVSNALRKTNGGKNGGSVLDYLPFTIKELINHITNQFAKPGNEWMTMKNRGTYRKDTWKNDDPSTWTWQLDHIIPHSDLPYDSMEHPNFQKCWALENLRPIRSDINQTEGARMIRHKKK